MRYKIADRYWRGAPNDAPKVSVAMITFNHEAFIADAIEGVLMQEVDFPVELVIGEDCSRDGTRNIILEYMEKYPGLIRLSGYKRNIGSAANNVKTVGRCRGRYIAMLDGDDYWTSPHKLQKQVELMDRRPEISLCFHAVNRVRDGKVMKAAVHSAGRRLIYRLSDLAHWRNIVTLSMLYRRSALPDFPDWYTQVGMGDWATQFLLAEQGDVAFIPDVMGTHRLHASNIWSGRKRACSEVLLDQIHEGEHFIRHLGDERSRPFERSQFRRYHELVHAYLDEGETEKARDLLHASYRSRGFDPRVDVLEPFLCLLHMKAPRLYRWLRLDAVQVNRLLHRTWYRLAGLSLGRISSMATAARKR